MSNIEKIKQLRQSTGAGFEDCSAAIEEAKGDLNKATDILRVKGISKASKKMSRVANEGVVAVSGDEKKISLIEVNCETDFVAKNQDYIDLANQLADHALNYKDLDSFINSDFNNMKVSDKLLEQTGIIGEKIELGVFKYLSAIFVGSYIHPGNKIAALTGLSEKFEKSAEVAKNISMQIAAMNPIALNEDGVSQEIIKKEIEIAKDQLRQEGKPEEMLENIAKGKMKKFFKENTLLNQQYIKDSKQSITDYINSEHKGLDVKDFARVSLG